MHPIKSRVGIIFEGNINYYSWSSVHFSRMRGETEVQKVAREMEVPNVAEVSEENAPKD